MDSGSSISPSLAYRAVALAVGLVAAGLLFEQLVDIFLLVILTVVIALPVGRGATRLQRAGVPRPVGAALCMLGGLGVLGLVLWLVIPPFAHQVDAFVRQLPATVTSVEHAINHAFGLKPGTVAGTVERFARRYTQHPEKLLGPLSSIGLTVFTGVGAIVVVLISALYTAIKPAPLIRGLVRLFPMDERQEVLRVLDRIAAAWLGWLRGIALDMLVLGGLLFVGMKIVGLQFAVGFAVFSALMTVIPNYGSVISAIPPIIYGLSHSFHEGVLVAVVYVIVNQIEGNVVLPLIMGRTARTHPAAVAIAVLIAGALFGAVGLVLSVPLLSLAQILLQEVWIKPQARRDAARGEERPDAVRRAVYGAIWFGAVLIVIGLLATQLVTLLLGVVFTVIISLPLAASANVLERRRVPRHLGALAGLSIGLGALGGLLAFLIPKMVAQVNELVTATPGIVHSVEVRIGHLIGQSTGHVQDKLQRSVTSWVHNPSHVLGPLASIGLGAATVIGGFVIAVMTAYYIAVRPQPLVDGLLAMVPARRRDRATTVISRLREAWLGWLRGLVISMAIIGVLLYLALTLFVGLPFALSFAVFSAVAEVVPYLGALVSGIPPVAFALTISPGTALAVLVIYIAVHQIEANVVAPLVMSRSVRLHPAVIAIGVVAVGEVFGLLGLVIAVPILSTVVIVTEELWIRPLERRRRFPLRKQPRVRRQTRARTHVEPRG